MSARIKAAAIILLCAVVTVLSGCAAEPVQEKQAEAVGFETAPPAPKPEALEVAAAPTAFLELAGGQELSWPCGVPFSDPGFSAVGKSGADMSASVELSGSVCCWKAGDYRLEYCFIDEDGEKICRCRTVHVEPVSLPETVLEENVIYLSFDDGPCENTAEVLEILDRYDAKATFFVITGRSNYLEILPEIKAAGHSIGIHANSHSYEWLYATEESFFEDFIKAQQCLYEYTGSYADICRFPGGSRTANGFLGLKMKNGMADIEQRLEQMGVRFYDWSVQPEASKSGSTRETYENFCGMVPKQEVPISLQHDTRSYSVKALEDMLQWGIENGYSFKAMDNTVPEVHFKLG